MLTQKNSSVEAATRSVLRIAALRGHAWWTASRPSPPVIAPWLLPSWSFSSKRRTVPDGAQHRCEDAAGDRLRVEQQAQFIAEFRRPHDQTRDVGEHRPRGLRVVRGHR